MSFSKSTKSILTAPEGIFFNFCAKKHIDIDTLSCETPFYQIDKGDFIYSQHEWDIKNNFIYYNNSFNEFEKLPALVPNRYSGDQWSKRSDLSSEILKGKIFLFTFMKMAELNNQKRGAPFIEFKFTSKQNEFMTRYWT